MEMSDKEISLAISKLQCWLVEGNCGCSKGKIALYSVHLIWTLVQIDGVKDFIESLFTLRDVHVFISLSRLSEAISWRRGLLLRATEELKSSAGSEKVLMACIVFVGFA